MSYLEQPDGVPRTEAREQERPPDALFVIGPPGSGGVALAGALGRLAPGTRVDGAPRISLEVESLAATHERSRFVFCWRPPEEATARAYEGWRSGAAVTHPELDRWSGPPWSFALIPDWQRLDGAELGTIVAEQWARLVETALEELSALDPGSWAVTSHAALLPDPAAELGRLCGFAGLDPAGLPSAAAMLRAELEADAAPEQLADDLAAALPRTAVAAERAQSWLAEPPAARRRISDAESPMRSVHTGSMPEILGQLGFSLAISTYQAGRLILARKDGILLNTHFRALEQPMGLAAAGGRLAIGTRSAVLEYHDMPAAAAKLEPAGSHDACYILRRAHVTGDVRIHDVAYASGEIWFVATAFSCLATLDADHSFVPRWRPPFVSRLSPSDRCHLNGMEVVDDEVRWATALGQTDSDGGWREGKASGGCLIHVPSREVVIAGISMPHSPRVYDGRLWMLESGEGRLCSVDLDSGSYETVAELPGFTRGLAFAGPFALVGLSQVRESATFGGLPLTKRLRERLCGVWAVDLRSGQIAGFLRFEDAVQEVYDVAVLPSRMPELAEPDSRLTRSSYVIKGWKR